MPSPLHLALAFLAAFVAGAINSVAGGGTMVSFPTLLALGLPSITANATNTVGIWPGSLGSILGFRRELAQVPRSYFALLLPALLGGAGGALLLRITPSHVFDTLVPWLILFATSLFILQAPVRKRLEASALLRSQQNAVPSPHAKAAAFFIQLLVALYGGYFGAGISIMMLATLGLFGMDDLLQMNAMTSLLSLAINGTAGLLFLATGLIDWPYLPAMALGSLLGGYGAAGLAKRIGKPTLRRFIILIGLSLTALMFYKLLHRT
jgi:uncharacterized membrane protein YfcA